MNRNDVVEGMATNHKVGAAGPPAHSFTHNP